MSYEEQSHYDAMMVAAQEVFDAQPSLLDNQSVSPTQNLVTKALTGAVSVAFDASTSDSGMKLLPKFLAAFVMVVEHRLAAAYRDQLLASSRN